MNQKSLFDNPQRPPQIDGATATEDDQRRAETAHDRIYALMRGGGEYTLREIADAGGCSEAAASARCRDFRKAKFKARYPCSGVVVRIVNRGLRVYRMVTDD